MFGLSKPVAYGLAALALLALAGLGFWRGVDRIAEWQASIARAAAEARDAKWKAEIERSNALVAEARATQARAALALAEALAAERQRTADRLAELETANASLPGADAICLDADRVRALRRARGQD